MDAQHGHLETARCRKTGVSGPITTDDAVLTGGTTDAVGRAGTAGLARGHGRVDAGAPAGPAAAGPPHCRCVVLRRPHGSRRKGDGVRGRYRPPSAQRPPPNRDLAALRRAAPPRQPRLGATDPSRSAQPDDGRRRGGARRGGHESQERRAAAGATVGGAARSDPARRAGIRAPSRSCRANSSSQGLRPSSSSATLPVTFLRHAGTRTTWVQTSSWSLPCGTTLPLRPDYEHALILLEGAVSLGEVGGGARVLAFSAPGATSAGSRFERSLRPAARRRAVSRALPHVVELRRPQPGRAERGATAVVGGGRAFRPGPITSRADGSRSAAVGVPGRILVSDSRSSSRTLLPRAPWFVSRRGAGVSGRGVGGPRRGCSAQGHHRMITTRPSRTG